MFIHLFIYFAFESGQERVKAHTWSLEHSSEESVLSFYHGDPRD